MKQPAGNRSHLGRLQFYFVLIFLISISSCSGQENKELHKEKVVSLNTDSSNVAATIVDDLFFIDGQLCQHLRKIFQDKKGNIWFGTNVYGLMRFDGESLTYFNKKNGHDFGRITGFSEDKDGNLWFSCYRGLVRYDGTSFTRFTEDDGLLNNEIWSFIIDSKGIFWIGTNEGVSRFDPTSLPITGKEAFTTFEIPKAGVKNPNTIYSANRITGIAEDKSGNLWFGTDGFGLCKYDPSAMLSKGGKSFTQFTTADGLSDNVIYDLMVDSKGNLWVGTFFGGVSLYNGTTFENFTTDGVIEGVEVGGFFEDTNGDIWFAAENNGVYRYNPTASLEKGEKAFTNFNEADGLATNGILCMYRDQENRFWFGGWGGLFRFMDNSFVSVTKDGYWEE